LAYLSGVNLESPVPRIALLQAFTSSSISFFQSTGSRSRLWRHGCAPSGPSHKFRCETCIALNEPGYDRKQEASSPCFITRKICPQCVAISVARRIAEAAKFVELEQLCLSPQCGFASTEEGNSLTEDEQWAKLARIVEVAGKVWGA
jgi:hypothetical protein